MCSQKTNETGTRSLNLSRNNSNLTVFSAAYGQADCLKLLIQNCEDPDTVDCLDEMDRTPLMIAVANGHIDAVLLLISQGANIQAMDAFGRTALHRGVSRNENSESL